MSTAKELIEQVINGDNPKYLLTEAAKNMLYKMFHVVTKPTKKSELDDISFPATITELMTMAKGGLNPDRVVGIYSTGQEADKEAKKLLKKLKK